MLHGLLFVCFTFCAQILAEPSEYISQFDSTIEIHKNGEQIVKENITYILKVDLNKHGILREIPTKYTDRLGNNYSVGFEILQILQDNQKIGARPANYRVENLTNGKRIYIGDPNKILEPGTYNYIITYKTNRQLGFFGSYDELYWNVTGNDWRLPIAHVTAKVILPANIPENRVNTEAYTGYQNDKNKNYISNVKNNTAEFKTTKPLEKFQGLTIVVTWPKGYVLPPSLIDKIKYFFIDNAHLIWLLLGLLSLLAFYIYNFIKTRQRPGVIIPLFEPPINLSPGEVRYIKKMGYDAKVFASEIVNMAVAGLLTIEYKKKFWSSSYILNKNKEHTREHTREIGAHSADRNLFKKLFPENKTQVELDYDTNIVNSTSQEFNRFLERECDYKYFTFGEENIIWGIVISIIFIVPAFFLFSYSIFTLVPIIIILLYIILHFIFGAALRTYTPLGQKIVDQINGFKLFLSTTETERLKVIGTPPTKTPELYEKYLPYAIALDVEEQWSGQFVPIFDRLQEQGKIYTPIWFTGPGFRFNGPLFASNLSYSFSQALKPYVVTSSSIPGSTSGSGGRGSSGGGGGGGGGGSW